MKLLGNILWLICGGLLCSLTWFLAGIFWCITIVGIPYGTQCFKFAKLILAPFGKDIEYDGGTGSLIANVIWILFFFPSLVTESLTLGIIFCATIVGIPFGLQFFKISRLSFMPFGAKIVNK